MRTDGITKIGLFLINPSTSNHLESFIITQSEIRWRFDVEKGQYKRFNLRTSLSFKEKVILERIKKGMTNEEIASNLNLSVPTIKTHRMRIFKKTVSENYSRSPYGNRQLQPLIIILASQYSLSTFSHRRLRSGRSVWGAS